MLLTTTVDLFEDRTTRFAAIDLTRQIAKELGYSADVDIKCPDFRFDEGKTWECSFDGGSVAVAIQSSPKLKYSLNPRHLGGPNPFRNIPFEDMPKVLKSMLVRLGMPSNRKQTRPRPKFRVEREKAYFSISFADLPNGYRFSGPGNGAGVTFDAATHQVTYVSIHNDVSFWRFDHPVTKSRAIATTIEAWNEHITWLRAKDFETYESIYRIAALPGPEAAELRLAVPNGAFPHAPIPESATDIVKSRVVWAVLFGGPRGHTIWVDAKTNQVVGGLFPAIDWRPPR